MTSTPAPARRLPLGWMEILTKAEREVQQALAAAQEREAMLDSLPELCPLDGPHQITLQRLKHWRERLRHLESRARQAAEQAAELEAQLADGEAKTRAWMSEAEALRQKLAVWEPAKC